MTDAPTDVSASTGVIRIDDTRFRALPADTPDIVTDAICETLTAHLGRPVPPDPDGVFSLRIRGGVLALRAHRSLPLILLRSVLTDDVADSESAAAEVAQLNAESLWCRYLLAGGHIVAESEMVDRVFVPVNLTVWLDEVVAELSDVGHDLMARRTGRLAG